MPAQRRHRRQHPGRALLAVTLAGAVAAILPAASARAANPVDVVFNSTGAEQSWAVPAGVTSIHVVLIGGRGGGNTGIGGAPDVVSGDLTVTAGSTLYVEVGGNGAAAASVNGGAGGFNGGGTGGAGSTAGGSGGGGASDVRTVSRAGSGTMATRLIGAAGGGGRGGGPTGGAGGTAGWFGDTVRGANADAGGGDPGTIARGGSGGISATGIWFGFDGGLGTGGLGGTNALYGGGGGGGGAYGGGGGAANAEDGGGGGGGGASFRGSAINTQITLDINNSQPSVTITYTPIAGPDPTATGEIPVEVVFQGTGAEQSWTVPGGVTSIHVELVGGKGGDAGPGGYGHVMAGDLAVVPGSTLYIEVGGNGANSIGLPGAAGGFNGGGNGGTGGGGATAGNAGSGGGGATDIRTVSRSSAGTLQSRLIVAGGGGGRGGDLTLSTVQRGGAGGTAGSAGSSGPSGSAGQGGGAGTASAGGSAGIGGASSPGTAGSGGVGGIDDNAGGGGGGGYYGGGGGGAGHFNVGGGGGGGGSSFIGAATNPSIAVDDTGTPKATITYGGGSTPPDETAGPDEGTVDASISMASSNVCIELSTNSVDFGNGRFGEVDVAGNPDIEVSNCGPDPVALYARGTDATATGASWSLVDDGSTCADTLGLDQYHLSLIDSETLDDEWGLGLTNTLLQSVDVGAVGSYGPRIDTACSGSSGAGQQMSMQIVFTATASVP